MFTEILRKMGFSNNTFSETIVVLGDSREYYVSPIGFKMDGELLVARIFTNTRLYKLLSSHGRECSICITQDPVLFYRAVLEKEGVRLISSRRISVPSISGCDAYVEGIVAGMVHRGLYVEASVKPVDIRYGEVLPRTYNRAGPAIIEALVYLTKIPYLKEESFKLYERILWCREIVYHSTGDNSLRKIIDTIVTRARELLGI